MASSTGRGGDAGKHTAKRDELRQASEHMQRVK